MKIKPGFILRKIADSYVIVPTGDNLVDFSAMITLNDTGVFLWNLINNDEMNNDKLTKALCEEYDVEYSVAENDVVEFLNILLEKGVVLA